MARFLARRYSKRLQPKGKAAAMAYVDLNPIRAGIAKSPESSEYTSIKARLQALKDEKLTALYFALSLAIQTTPSSKGSQYD